MLIDSLSIDATTSRSHPSELRRRVQGLAALLLGTFAAALAIFARMTRAGVNSDILIHAAIARADWAEGRWFTYSAWYPLLYAASAGERLIDLRTASILLLAGATSAKVVLSRRAARAWGATSGWASLIALATFFATPLLAVGQDTINGFVYTSRVHGAIYLGQFSATLWHNSTSIASLPLVLAAALSARRMIDTPRLGTVVWTSAWLTLSALMKPNYALIALPVLTPVLLWISARTTNRRTMLGYLAVISLPVSAVLALQLVLVHLDPNVVQVALTWDPLRLWRHYSRWPILSTFLSVAFPLAATVAVRVRRREWDRWLLTCWTVLAIGILQVACLGERNRMTGLRTYDGNWFWGPHAAVLVLFVACGAALARPTHPDPNDGPSQRRASRTRTTLTVFAWVLFAMHVLTGMLYVWRLFHYTNGFET